MKRSETKKKRSLDGLAIVTTVCCLLPLIFSAAVYKDLPEQMAIHWGPGNEPDGWAPRAFAAFGLPVVIAVLNLLCHIGSNRAGQKERQPGAVLLFCKWLPAILSLIATPMILLAALGWELPIGTIALCIVGVLLLFVGNYLPKCRQNRTMGIRLPWTLRSEENWDKTHRMAGPLWMLGGVAVLVLAFFVPRAWAVWTAFAVLALFLLSPVLYSFLLSRKEH